MKLNLAKRDNNVLDHMLDIFGMTDEEGMPPILDEERALLKLQLLCAQTLAKDVIELTADKDKSEAKKEELLNELSANMQSNIKMLANEIINDQNFQIDIINTLKRFNKKW